MKLLYQLFVILSFLGFSLSTFAEEESKQSPWPFDQRQIVLIKDSDKGFPDDLTVAQIMDIFVKRGRIRWVTKKAGKADIEPIVTPSDFAWHSTPAVRQLGLRHKADGIVYLTQKDSQIDLKWYATLDGLPLFFESISLPAVESDKDWEKIRRDRLTKWLNEIWDRIPGHGYVVQRDGGSILLEGVEQMEGTMGQKVDLIRVQSIERHPVLKTIIKINSSDTGYGKILSVGKSLSKAEIIYEAEIDPIQAGDRYILSKEDAKAVPSALIKKDKKYEIKKESEENKKGNRISFFENKKKMIDLTGGATFSSVSHNEIISGANYNMKSSKLAPGFDLRALMYFTHAWIMGLDFSISFFKFKNVPTNYGVTSIGSGLTSYKVYGGYRFLFLENLAAPAELRILAGYRSWSLSMQNTSTDFAPSAKTFSGLELGIVAGFPIYKGFSAQFQGGRSFGTSLSEKPQTSGDAPDATFWTFGGKFTYALDKMNQLEFNYTYESAAANFDGAGQRTKEATSVTSQRKSIGVGYTYAF